jgi:hypothetical protein
MTGIKFSHLTKEIELKGSDSFIESNFDKIHELLIESFGVGKKMISRRTKAKREPVSGLKVYESQTRDEMGRREPFNANQSSPTIMTSVPHISHEVKMNRPPVRKYIRKVGIPGQEKIMVEALEQKPRELSLAQLKEKFGLSEAKNGGTIWHAQRRDRVRKDFNKSYV